MGSRRESSYEKDDKALSFSSTRYCVKQRECDTLENIQVHPYEFVSLMSWLILLGCTTSYQLKIKMCTVKLSRVRVFVNLLGHTLTRMKPPIFQFKIFKNKVANFTHLALLDVHISFCYSSTLMFIV